MSKSENGYINNIFPLLMYMIIVSVFIVSIKFIQKHSEKRTPLQEIISSAEKNGYSIHVVQHTTNNHEKIVSILNMENNEWAFKPIGK